jgi:pyridoxal phosphate enzyme (YggS family)
MSSLYTNILNSLTQHHAQLIAVSKTKPNEAILNLYNQGQRAFGENKVQELLDKHEQLPNDIQWHMIGHLQTNKVKYLVPFIHLIHSVDSLKLLFEIEKQAEKANRTVSVLLQIHIASEESKFGLDEKELIEILEYYTASPSPLNHICIKGLMGMATNTDDMSIRRNEFKHLTELFKFAKNSYLPHRDDFNEISMGMSDDYTIALEEGATMIRIGSLLFGNRS